MAPFSIRKILEILGFFLVILGINFLLDRENLLYYKESFNIYLYLMAIISLYYGVIYGLEFYILYFGAEFLIYHTLNYYNIAHYFGFLFIFSEFMYFWNKKIKTVESENGYLKDRIEEISSSYYLLKISHDELEKAYILKPFSIRESLREIRELIKRDKNQAYNNFSMLLKKLFKLEKASLYIKTPDDRYILAHHIGEKVPFIENDPLLEDAFENHNMTYVINLGESKSKYLAVLPVLSLQNELKGVLLIKEMPFFNLTKDNLIIISLFLTYFINSLQITKKYRFPFPDPFINSEIEKLIFLSKKYNIESYIVIYKIEDEMQRLQIKENLRGMDIGFDYEDKLGVILPFTSSISLMKFIDRIKKIDSKIKHKTISLKKEKKISNIKRMFDEF